MSADPHAFDPYHKWLGIPPKDQPPNFYRLLGVEKFEVDSDTIANAADQRMMHVRSFQTGKYSAESQKLLNELAAARVCLLKPDKKAAYDASLKRSAPVATARAIPVENSISAETIFGDLKSAPSRPKAAPQKSNTPLVVAIASAVVLLIGGVVFVTTRAKPVDVVRTPSTPASGDVKSATEKSQESKPKLTTVAPEVGPVGSPLEPPKPAEIPVDLETARTSKENINTEEPAVLNVERMQPLQLRIRPRPPFLQEAMYYEWQQKPKTNVSNGELRFTTEKTGLVYLVATWRREGSNVGSWDHERLNKNKLIQRGWQEVGPCDWDPERILFKRVCQQGESFVIRTNKFWPPIIILTGTAPTSQNEDIAGIDELGWSQDTVSKAVSALPLATEKSQPSADLRAKTVEPTGSHNETVSQQPVAKPSPEYSSEEPAVVEVKDQKPYPNDYRPLPEFLKGGRRYRYPQRPKTDVANGVLHLQIEKSGIVYLGHSMKFEGEDDGKWDKERLTREQLAEQGWQDIGEAPWDSSRILFKRYCNAGETYTIRTNKFWPPLVILPPSATEVTPSPARSEPENNLPTQPTQPKQAVPIANLMGEEKVEVEGSMKGLDGTWNDILKLVVPTKHAVFGTWRRIGPAISISASSGPSRVAVPVTPRGDYDLELEFTRAKGTRTGLILPVGGRYCYLSLDETPEIGDFLPRVKDVVVPTGDRHTLNVSVRDGNGFVQVAAQLDSKPLVNWRGNAYEIQFPDQWNIVSPGLVALAAGEGSSVSFHAMRLREPSSVARPAHELASLLLAQDVHRGKSGVYIEKNVYSLKADHLVSLQSTKIRYRYDTSHPKCEGVVSISGDGKSWIVAGNWTREKLSEAKAVEGWLEIDLSGMPAAKTPQLQVKFVRSGGGDPFFVEEVQWIELK